MKNFSVFVVVLLLFLISVQSEEKVSDNSEVFVPTKEWKVVKKGQPIPPGLHVRMNLQTGVTEAKLMDSEDEKTPRNSGGALIVVNPPQSESNEEYEATEAKIVQTPQHVDGVHVMSSEDGEQTVFANGKLTPQQLQEALQNFDFEDLEVATDEDVERVKDNFRSIEKLKEELADLNLGMRTEAEEVAQLMQQYLEADDDEDDQLSALRELEYIVHHVDAARDLVQGNGLKLIVIPALNSSSYNLQSASARLIGSASQGNPTVQLAALQEGVLRLLLRHLTLGNPDSFDESQQKIKATVYAISCIVRGFPSGQRYLVDQGGLSIFAKLFDDANIDIKIKITTLLHDLVLEASQASKAKDQYQALGLHKKLSQYGWCERISSLLYSPNVDLQARHDDLSSESLPELPLLPEHDVVDKVISAMLVLSPQCKQQFQPVLQTVKEIIYSYQKLVAHEEISDDDTSFYSEILHEVKKLSLLISMKDEL